MNGLLIWLTELEHKMKMEEFEREGITPPSILDLSTKELIFCIIAGIIIGLSPLIIFKLLTL